MDSDQGRWPEIKRWLSIESIHLERGTNGVCVVSLVIDGRLVPVIRDGGEIISHYVERSAVDEAIRKGDSQ